MAQPTPQPKPARVTAYAVERRRDNTFVVATLTLEGDRVLKRVETAADTLDATLGRLFLAVKKGHTA